MPLDCHPKRVAARDGESRERPGRLAPIEDRRGVQTAANDAAAGVCSPYRRGEKINNRKHWSEHAREIRTSMSRSPRRIKKF